MLAVVSRFVAVRVNTETSEEAEIGREQVENPELIGETVRKTSATTARERMTRVRVDGDEVLERRGNDIFVLVDFVMGLMIQLRDLFE